MALSFLHYVAILALISLIFHASYVFGRLGVKDIPNERSLHTEITKKSGGMVFIPLFLVYILVWIYGNPENLGQNFYLRLLLLGCAFFCFLGFLDDLYHLSPNFRLILEFSFSLLWIYFLDPAVSLFGHTLSGPFLIVTVTGFCLVFIVNLVNFMDGLDLYLIGTLFISILFWSPVYSLSFLPGQNFFIVLTLFLCAISGFSFFNFPKAKLFMGDSGSLAIGFLFIALPLLVSKESNESFELLTLFFLFPIFWIDGIVTIVIRASQKKHLFRAHREHLYQILTETRLGKTGTCFISILSNLPATIVYSLFQLKLLELQISKDTLILIIIFVYIVIYSFLRFVFFRKRKNLA
jgi:UDP-N-acetylmuramyl pentapeptide phosphotransferase/UDP-N-acetylglucosamine-1-phosphate transferase